MRKRLPTPTQIQESPILSLTGSTDSAILDSAMPASGAITKQQLERDVVRARQEMQQIRNQAKLVRAQEETVERMLIALETTLRRYFPESDILRQKIEEGERPASLDHLTIADACGYIFGKMGSAVWLSLADLDTELRRHNKVCNPGSIELALKNDPDRFEFEKKGKRNFYRLKDEEKVNAEK